MSEPIRLGRGPILDGMAVGDHADRLGLGHLVHEHAGDPRPAGLGRSLRTAAERTVDLLLRLAASTGGSPAHLVTLIEEHRVDVRLVAADAAGVVDHPRHRRLVAELSDWAEAFGGDVVLLANAHGVLIARVSLHRDGAASSRPQALPEPAQEWEILDVPAGPLFGDGSAVL